VIKKIFASLILWVLIFIRTTGVTLAQEEKIFATSYEVLHDIASDGTTSVTEKITLRNLTSQYYANQFKMTIGATEIFDVKASDEGGPMEVKTQQVDSLTVIDVKFNTAVAGLDKTLNWTLQFKSKDFAEKIGKVWEIRAPRISSSDIEKYSLTMSIPQSFGEPTLITPTPKTSVLSAGRMYLTFNRSQLLESGVSASFGQNQLFDFDLTYHLENIGLVPVLTNIALPPDTAFQDVIYQRIEPKPINVTIDNDGNYLAWYKLSRGEKLDIKVIGSAKLYTVSKVKDPILSEALRKKYTQSDKYWEKDNPIILAKLNEILGINPPTETSEKAKLIFRYVVGALKYDSGRLKDDIERFGAVTALNNPTSAVCMEFTDLFIALARSAGIPTRELDGYAYTANPKLRPLSLNQDILHAWPEYFDDKKGWVMVDPTWENTTGGVDYFSKLDLNHFVFAIKGSSSSQPAPAGSYKYQGQDSRDVKVTLSDVDFLGKPQIDVTFENKNPILAGFPGKIKVKVTNLGNAFYPSNDMSISAGKISILNTENLKSGPIPSFGTAEFELGIKTASLFDSYTDEITVLMGGQKFSKQVEVKPFIIFQTAPALGFAIAGLMVVLYLTILGVLIYRKRFAK